MNLPLTIDNGEWGPTAIVTGEWSSALEECILSRGVKALELNQSKGWRGKDIKFLERIKGLEAFRIIDFTIKDLTAIHSLTALKSLKIYTYCKTPIDFNIFKLLKECVLEWRPKSDSLFSHQGLKKLFVIHCPLKNFQPMNLMSNLESLSLASPQIQSFQGIEALKSLTLLAVYSARQLKSIEGVQLLHNLEQLEVNTCRKVRDISPVATLLRLRKFHLINGGGIETIKPLIGLKELEQFLFSENTNVLDGDLSPLKALPKLKDVSFMERKHYSHRRVDLPSAHR